MFEILGRKMRALRFTLDDLLLNYKLDSTKEVDMDGFSILSEKILWAYKPQ